MTENAWVAMAEADPEHSTGYAQRFRALAASGADIVGEARLVDAMLARGSRILDAGCGPGRIGGYLAQAGHDVVGVDVDPVLITAAVEDHPGPRWLIGDLAVLDLPDRFDAIVCAGNVVTFLAPGSRVEVLRRFHAHLAPGGRAVVGFNAGRDYAFDDFLADAATAALAPDLLLSSWHLHPFSPDADYLVAVLAPG